MATKGEKPEKIERGKNFTEKEKEIAINVIQR